MKLFIFSTLLLLTFSSSHGQVYSSFDYKKGKQATVFAMENNDPSEKFLLAFKFRSHFNMVFLDDSLGLQRMQKTASFNPDVWDKNVLGVLNLEKDLYVFMPTGDLGPALNTDLYRFRKEDGALKLIRLRFTKEQEKELSDGHVKLVKIFQYENRFYKIWVNTKTSMLYIFFYEIGEKNFMDFKRIPLPVEGIGKRLGRRKVIPTPIITDYRDVSLMSNAKQEKIYMFEGEMLITVEDLEKGQTDLLAINTDTWDLYLESYPVSGFQADVEIQNFNSYIYDGLIYHILYNEEGLRVHKTDFDTGDLLTEIHWPSEEDFAQDFPIRRRRQFRGKNLSVSQIAPNWRWLERSIGLLIQPEDSVERLMIGSHIYMDQRGRDILNTASAIAFVAGYAAGAAGFTLIGNGGSFSITIDPFASINSIIDATFYFSEGRTYQYDTYFDSENFDISNQDVNPARWEEVMGKVYSEEKKQKLSSVSLFERGDKFYFGYWRKKRYYLLEF